MEIKLVKQSYAELNTEFTADEIKEMYGESVKNVFYTELSESTGGSLIGIQKENNTFSVYGAKQDTNNTTFTEMLEMLFCEWDLLK